MRLSTTITASPDSSPRLEIRANLYPIRFRAQTSARSQKACPRFDRGWEPVFGKDHAQANQGGDDHASLSDSGYRRTADAVRCRAGSGLQRTFHALRAGCLGRSVRRDQEADQKDREKDEGKGGVYARGADEVTALAAHRPDRR